MQGCQTRCFGVETHRCSLSIKPLHPRRIALVVVVDLVLRNIEEQMVSKTCETNCAGLSAFWAACNCATTRCPNNCFFIFNVKGIFIATTLSISCERRDQVQSGEETAAMYATATSTSAKRSVKLPAC